MGLFNKLNEPIVLKEESEAQNQLRQMEYYQLLASDKIKSIIEHDKSLVKYGLAGEQALLFELKNSHLPMYIIHDLFLESGDCKAQIDYLVVTRKTVFLLECKNLYGNITVDSNGNFIRKINYGNMYRQEGIYSPITQNERHLELVRVLRRETKNILSKAIFDNNFYNRYKSLIVLANPKSYIDYRFAPKDIKAKIVRTDGIIRKIKEINEQSKTQEMSDTEMKNLADFFMSKNIKSNTDYTAKYQTAINKESELHAQNSYVDITTDKTNSISVSEEKSALTAQDYENTPLYNELKKYRLDKSRAEGVKPYYIYKNDELIEIIKLCPSKPEELKTIKGFGDGKIAKYGNDIINIIKKYQK